MRILRSVITIKNFRFDLHGGEPRADLRFKRKIKHIPGYGFVGAFKVGSAGVFPDISKNLTGSRQMVLKNQGWQLSICVSLWLVRGLP